MGPNQPMTTKTGTQTARVYASVLSRPLCCVGCERPLLEVRNLVTAGGCSIIIDCPGCTMTTIVAILP
jgi:hypothetical protein